MKTTINAPFKRGRKTVIEPVTGTVAVFTIGDRKVRVILHAGKITEASTGRGICRFHDVRTRLHAQRGHPPSERFAAEVALLETIDRVGVAKFWAAIDAAPVLNP